jgi:outer membrane protein assembly factor BamB
MRYRETGVLTHDRNKATPGVTLIVRLRGTAAYLVDMNGRVVHEWTFPYQPGNNVYLLENGNLLWSGEPDDESPLPGEKLSRFTGGEGPPLRGGRGGLIREYDWDGNILWEYANPEQHHDCRRLANGNTLYLGWEIMPAGAAERVRGGQPGTEHNGLIYGDYLHEITPAGEVVWEWHAHSDMEVERYPLCTRCYRNEFAHANACAPLPNGDVMLSFRRINLIAIVDHKTRQFRWEHRDDSWGHQHDCEMLANGNIQFFANGIHGGEIPSSRIIELDPETKQTVWEYKGSPSYTFYSPHISGAQRLASGNTLICEGQWGRVFEVTPAGEIVWEYISPFFDPFQQGGMTNMMFRAYRYAVDSPEIRGRVSLN